jgi:hypothetical protein
MIEGVPPVHFPVLRTKLIPTRLISGVEIEKLAHFAASVRQKCHCQHEEELAFTDHGWSFAN